MGFRANDSALKMVRVWLNLLVFRIIKVQRVSYDLTILFSRWIAGPPITHESGWFKATNTSSEKYIC